MTPLSYLFYVLYTEYGYYLCVTGIVQTEEPTENYNSNYNYNYS